MGIEGFLPACWHSRDTVGTFIPDGFVLARELREITETLSGISVSLISLIITTWRTIHYFKLSQDRTQQQNRPNWVVATNYLHLGRTNSTNSTGRRRGCKFNTSSHTRSQFFHTQPRTTILACGTQQGHTEYEPRDEENAEIKRNNKILLRVYVLIVIVDSNEFASRAIYYTSKNGQFPQNKNPFNDKNRKFKF